MSSWRCRRQGRWWSPRSCSCGRPGQDSRRSCRERPPLSPQASQQPSELEFADAVLQMSQLRPQVCIAGPGSSERKLRSPFFQGAPGEGLVVLLMRNGGRGSRTWELKVPLTRGEAARRSPGQAGRWRPGLDPLQFSRSDAPWGPNSSSVLRLYVGGSEGGGASGGTTTTTCASRQPRAGCTAPCPAPGGAADPGGRSLSVCRLRSPWFCFTQFERLASKQRAI